MATLGLRGVVSSVVDVIGQTPLVDLGKVTRHVDGRILMKLEFLNPGFSKKDRAALRIVEEAEQCGALQPGQTVIELTSGNMGTGLAMVCTAKGYPFVAVMSKGNSPERAAMMRALGARVILVDQRPTSKPGEVSGADLELVEQETSRLAAELGAFRADQFARLGNRNAHYDGTAAEIWTQSRGRITAFCDFVGSGGTFAGCSRYFRERDSTIRCYVIEPETAAVLSGASVSNPAHPIQGGGYAMSKLAQLEDVNPDGYLPVSTETVIECTRRLAREEGIFAGYSTGANLAGALALLSGPLPGATVATIACDSGLKYLSTDLWNVR